MGPLITQGLIGENWNFVIAFIIGISFGFILEQAGFSSSRKLAGVFYGYDFVVLRVFFTAAITAMIGMLFFHYFGWMDLDLVWVNPTYLRSAIIGGVIMGLGFIIGGFCPGTSVCALSIGKIDALFFVGGIFLGVFLFAEAYSLLDELYMADAFGPMKVYESLGISRGIFAFALIAMAIGAFFITARIEKNASKVDY
jgi:uncharacterized protein